MRVFHSRCEAVGTASRRTFLIGAAALGEFEFLPALFRYGASAKKTKDWTGISELIDENDLATARARAMAGQAVTLRGYLSPGLRSGVALDLFERSPAPCLACGFVHDPGRSLPVISMSPPSRANPLRLTEVKGILQIDDERRVTVRA